MSDGVGNYSYCSVFRFPSAVRLQPYSGFAATRTRTRSSGLGTVALTISRPTPAKWVSSSIRGVCQIDRATYDSTPGNSKALCYRDGPLPAFWAFAGSGSGPHGLGIDL